MLVRGHDAAGHQGRTAPWAPSSQELHGKWLRTPQVRIRSEQQTDFAPGFRAALQASLKSQGCEDCARVGNESAFESSRGKSGLLSHTRCRCQRLRRTIEKKTEHRRATETTKKATGVTTSRRNCKLLHVDFAVCCKCLQCLSELGRGKLW